MFDVNNHLLFFSFFSLPPSWILCQHLKKIRPSPAIYFPLTFGLFSFLLFFILFYHLSLSCLIFRDDLAMFVSRKVVSGKPFSKLSCVCLSLEKLVNEKYFSVNFSQIKIWLGFQESVFLLAVSVFRKVVSGKSLSKLSCVCLPLEKLVNGKYFPVKGKFGLVFRKVFSWKFWGENTFRKLWKI